MPRGKPKKTPLERVREARLLMIDAYFGRVLQANGEPMKPTPEDIAAFRELCQSAEEDARRETEESDVAAISEKLQALIDAHNKLAEVVDEQDGRLRAVQTKLAGEGRRLRMG